MSLDGVKTRLVDSGDFADFFCRNCMQCKRGFEANNNYLVCQIEQDMGEAFILRNWTDRIKGALGINDDSLVFCREKINVES